VRRVPRELPGTPGPSTLPSSPNPRRTRAVDRAVEGVGIGLVVVVVVLALTGVLGVRTSSADSTSDGITVRVDHGAVVRPGLAAPLSIDVRLDGALDADRTVEISIDESYLEIFDENGWRPAPTDEHVTADGRAVMEVTVPAGEPGTSLSFDARIGPAVEPGRHRATIEVVSGDDRASVDLTTLVLP
jgi:hypothetical protein